MASKKGKRKYSVRRCGKPTTVDCSIKSKVCVGCSWPKTKAIMAAAAMASKGSGNKVPLRV